MDEPVGGRDEARPDDLPDRLASSSARPPRQQFANQLASDGAVLGYKGTDSFYLRAPNGAETPVNGLVGHNGVNAKHTVIGTILSSYMGQPIPHAAIWKPDGTVVDLNSLLGPNSDLILLRRARHQ